MVGIGTTELIILATAVAIIVVRRNFPDMTRRFSLRTRLTAATLVAVVLGLVVYAAR